MTPTLRTARLVLSPYAPEDEEAFVGLFQDASVSRWMGDGTSSESADRALFRRVFTQVYAENRFDVWAVRRDGRLIGHAEIKPSPTKSIKGHEIIYALAPSDWGVGLGTELAKTLLSYGYETLGLAEVHATVHAGNEASLAVLKKLGFGFVRDIAEDDGTTTCVLSHQRD